MPAKRTNVEEPKRRRRSPATTPEALENQVISEAFDLARQQIKDGTASAQVLSHFLKLGSSRERLEQSRLRKENEFLDAKIKTVASAAVVEELYTSAIAAMRAYSGQPPVPSEGDYDDD